jgi:hypothetical protein
MNFRPVVEIFPGFPFLENDIILLRQGIKAKKTARGKERKGLMGDTSGMAE